MRALLLAAGLGTRLRPLTNHLPKCLVPIHGTPLLEYWLEALITQGIEKVLINTHYLEPVVRQYIGKSAWLPYIELVHEEALLGTGGTVLNNQNFFRGEAFFMAHADNLTLFDLAKFVEQHSVRPKGSEITMMTFKSSAPETCGVVELDGQQLVQAFHEKVNNPPGNLANAAVYIIEPSVVGWMETLKKPQLDLSTEVIPHYVGKIFTYENTVYHRDIGTMDSWEEANRDFPHKMGH